MRRPVVLASAGAAAAAVLGLTALTVAACIPISILQVSPGQASAGGQVNVYIHEISGSDYPPVTFHWDGVDGPVLATVQPSDDTTGVGATVSVPANATVGPHQIVATEPLPDPGKGEFPTWGMPVRGAISVTAGGGGAAPLTPQTGNGNVPTAAAGLATDSGFSTASLALIGFGVLVVAIVLAGIGAYAFGAGRGQAQRSGADR